MAKVKKTVLPVLYSIKRRLSLAKLWLGVKLGLIRSVMIMPYQGFGNGKELFFPGRVLRDRGIGISQLEDSKWWNFKKMYKRFMTWKIPVVYSNVFVPPENLEFGVISDIDDTVVPTGATRLWEMLKTTFLGNALTRVPFPGVAAFYQALSKGWILEEDLTHIVEEKKEDERKPQPLTL